MTQFALAKVRQNAGERTHLHFTRDVDEGLIGRAATHIFKDSSSIFVLTPYGSSFDEIYLSAQRDVAEGMSPDETDLFLALSEISSDISALALWYGNDFIGLPLVTNWKDLFFVLSRDLEEPSLETYVLLSNESQ